jgi:hypothetical protein
MRRDYTRTEIAVTGVTVAAARHHHATAGERLCAWELELDGHFCPHGHFLFGLEFNSIPADAERSW